MPRTPYALFVFVALGAVGLLVAVEPTPDAGERIQAMQAAIDPPRLWSAEVVSGAQPVQVYICADSVIRDGFARTIADVNGELCLADRVAATADSYVTYCSTSGRRYAVSLRTEGDRSRDFRATFTLHTLEAPIVSAWQVRRYRLVGACPTGWRVDESAAPGDKQL
ncbi:MAG: hypothetical protein ACXWKR_06925, partial [Phenylobacterium sp.]